MAEVRSSTGVPAASAFEGLGSPSPGTPLVVNTNNGDLYVLISGVATKVAGGTAFKMKATDQSKTTDTTLADDNTLVIPILASETWGGRCFIDCAAGLTTTGMKFTIAGPSGATGNIHATLMTDATSGKVNQINNTNTLGSAITLAAADFPASVTLGLLEVIWRVANSTTAGNISFQWAQATSSATALTLGAGSQMNAFRV